MFGGLNDHNSNVSQVLREHISYRLRENLGTGSRVYYLPVDDTVTEG
jgi:Fe-S-cluster-containing dehydrogenase component